VLASTISAFATLTLLTKNSFLDEIKKQYVMTARAKGLKESGACSTAMSSATRC
jgi:microcin C transport system permease protein